MTLRCFLFCSDEATCDLIRQLLSALGVEGETCPTPSTAVEKVSQESFHLVIIDWDQQPEAGMVLSAARERKAAARPLSLAIVSDDASVPKALQAGANSILRKPLIANQVTDTLTTARDLRSRQESAVTAAQAAVAASAPATTTLPASIEAGKEKTLRAGEFLQSAPLNPSAAFVTESTEQSVSQEIDPLKDLEPVAVAPVVNQPPPSHMDEPRGLDWYLKVKGIQRPGMASSAPPTAAPEPPANRKPELLGYDQAQSHSAPPAANENLADESFRSAQSSGQEQKKEAELFAYISGESDATKETSSSRFRIGTGAILAALALAACAIVAAPQAPWHPHMRVLWAHGQRSLHTWLHPQPVTTAQAPTSHEDFGRAGDEYKLPVAESIPDATTDPSQIQVIPAVDPTAKKPAGDGTTPDQPQTPTDATPGPAPDTPQPSTSESPAQTPTIQVQQTPSVQTAPASSPTTIAAPPTTTTAPPASTTTTPTTTTPHVEQPTAAVPTVTPAQAPPKRQPAQYVPVTTKVPSSLQSQMAVMTPEASGNKPPEAAMPAIEPVDVPELTERNLITDQPAMTYPASAKNQQGTVILQVLIGRDGTVQDAKFLQGSLAFARTAIDGVKQWKFKPYTINGRPVSVATTLTIKFKPGQ